MTTAATIKSVLTLDTTNFESGITKAKSQAGSFEDKMKQVGSKMKGVGIGMSAAITAPIVLGTKMLLEAGNEFEGIQAGYENFANTAGVAADEFLDSMIKASYGTLAQKDAMLAFNQAAGLVSTDFALTLPGAMETFMKVAAATGQDASQVLSDYVTGVGRGSKMILDNLGITVDIAKANEDYAAKLGLTVDQLTAEQQKLALNEQAMGLLTEKYAGMSGVLDSNAVKSQQFQANMQNLKDTLGVFLTDAVGPFIEKLNELATEYIPKITEWLDKLDPKQKQMIVTVLAIIAVLGPLLVIFGTLISSIGTIVGAFSAVATFIGGTLIPAIAAISAPVLIIIGVIVALIAIWLLWGDEIKAWAVKTWASIKEWAGNVGSKIKEVVDNIKNKITDVWGKITGAIDKVKAAIQAFIDKIKEIAGAMPEWLIPGSPTPFEMGLRGVNKQFDILAKKKGPDLGFDGGVDFSADGTGSNGAAKTIYLGGVNVTIQGNATEEDVRKGVSLGIKDALRAGGAA